MSVTVLECFAGIGGMSFGLERAGMDVVGQIEIDPWCRQLLARHWPEVPRHDDIHTAPEWWAGRSVDVISGGPPCQPNSLAGRGLAQADPRWLWPAMAALIASARPRAVIIEGVPGLRNRGLVDILHDLRGLGFHGRAGVLGADQLGAPQHRKRIFVLAYAQRPGCRAGRGRRTVEARPPTVEQGRPGVESDRSGWWPAEPDVGRVAYGVPGRVDPLRGLGNAVVPAVAETIGRIVIEQLGQYERPGRNGSNG